MSDVLDIPEASGEPALPPVAAPPVLVDQLMAAMTKVAAGLEADAPESAREEARLVLRQIQPLVPMLAPMLAGVGRARPAEPAAAPAMPILPAPSQLSLDQILGVLSEKLRARGLTVPTPRGFQVHMVSPLPVPPR